MTFSATHLDKLCIDTVRCLAMDAIQKANSGHPGAPMGQAPAAYMLWTKFLKHNPKNANWADRDRFVLSCGHASMLIYSLLHLTGYGLELEDLKNFRQWNSKTPGHPEFGHTVGVETTTGPLGQGIANAVGMAIAERWMADRFNRPSFDVVDHRTYAFCGDGCLQEGISYEAISLAGHLKLDKLVLLWDNNKITIEGETDLTWTEDVHKRFDAAGWRVLKVENGEDLAGLHKAFEKAQERDGRPTLIDCRTIIGWPAPTKQNSHAAHGAPLGEDEIRATKEILGFNPDAHFEVPAEALQHWRECQQNGAVVEAAWNKIFECYKATHPELASEFEAFLKGELPADLEKALPTYAVTEKAATREASGKVLNAIAHVMPNLVGGSADLAPSNNSWLKDGGVFTPTTSGRNFHFGIREHAMGAILNGMSLHGGMRVFGATFLIFCDYMRPSIRLASLMKQPVTYIFTHDSIGVGEDGPTHQPIEQVASLRLIPGMTVIRPADANETVVAWKMAIQKQDGPVALALTRQKLPVLDAAKAQNTAKGAYILEEGSRTPKVILVASGSEVHLALDARKVLEAEGVSTRVVSMPSWEVFEKQGPAYKEEVLPKAIQARVSIEAATSFGWQRYAPVHVGRDDFGASAPAEILFEKFGFTVENVVKTAKSLI